MMDEQFLIELKRIAAALEKLAQGSEPEEPNLQRPIGEYAHFDWSSIGATVVQQDPDGPTHLEYGGFLWMRRSPKNKYSPAIWFSRPAGKDTDGNVRYLRLISFREISEADPLPEKAAALTGKTAEKKTKVESDPKVPKAASQPEDAKPTTDPTKPNGKRPYTPAQLRIRLGEIQALHIGKTASDAQRGLVAMLLEACFAGSNDAIDKRHTVQKYLFGVASLKDIFDANILAALDWLKPTQVGGGGYQPDAMAIQEARAVYAQALKDEGQKEFPL